MYVCVCVCVCVCVSVCVCLCVCVVCIYIYRNPQVKISTQIIIKLDKVYHMCDFLFVSYCLMMALL